MALEKDTPFSLFVSSPDPELIGGSFLLGSPHVGTDALGALNGVALLEGLPSLPEKEGRTW